MNTTTTSISQINWRSHLYVLFAIAKNDWLHFVRYPLNAIFKILEPIIWLTPIYFLGQAFATEAGNVGFEQYAGTSDYMSFILLGAFLNGYVSSVFWGMGMFLKVRMDMGVLESDWMAPIPRFILLIGHTFSNIAMATLVNSGTLFLGWLFFGFRISGNILPAIFIILPMLIALYGFGFAFAALVLLLRDSDTIIDVSEFLVNILSGSQFPILALPKVLLPFAFALPLTYGYDAVRSLLINTETLIPIEYEFLILVIFMCIMAPLGYGVFIWVERRSKQLGTIGLH